MILLTRTELADRLAAAAKAERERIVFVVTRHLAGSPALLDAVLTDILNRPPTTVTVHPLPDTDRS